MAVTLKCADVMKWAETTPPLNAMALICDPPYELNFMGNGKKDYWDNTGIAFRPETWQALAQHLHPGAFGACFASSRGWHRLACAIEDAGLILHPSVFMLGWLQASGWPKSTRIDTQVDKAAGAERETIGAHSKRFRAPDSGLEGWQRPGHAIVQDITAPATPLAALWEQHRYGGQVLKPAVEPILIWQKPYRHAPVEDITRTGAGALWIDGCRVGTANTQRCNYGEIGYKGDNLPGAYVAGSLVGRWPSNVSLIHTPACRPDGVKQVQGTHIPGPALGGVGYQGVQHNSSTKSNYTAPDGTETVPRWVCAPDCPIASLEAQGGVKTSSSGSPFQRHPNHNRATYGYFDGGEAAGYYGDTGPVPRFFSQFGWADDIAERLALADPLHYCAKASQAERSNGLPSRNRHPTVKPLELLRWLCALFLAPVAYAPRRLLVPFSGSGSEMVSAIQTGWEEVVGIEQDPAYVEIARRRIAYWTGQQTTAPVAPHASVTPTVPAAAGEQLGLFTTHQ
jgi:hypothetical protein